MDFFLLALFSLSLVVAHLHRLSNHPLTSRVSRTDAKQHKESTPNQASFSEQTLTMKTAGLQAEESATPLFIKSSSSSLTVKMLSLI